MKKLRLLTLSAFASLAAIAFLATRTEAEPGEIKLIVPGVWFREGDLANLGHCNNIIIEMNDYLIVVDANFPSGARLTMEDAHESRPSRSSTCSIRITTATMRMAIPYGPRRAPPRSPMWASPKR